MKKLFTTKASKLYQLKSYHMKRKMFLVCMLAATSLISTAQEKEGKAYAKGDKLLNIGIGVNSYYSGGIPFGASFESGITDEISVGANVDYLSNKYDYGTGYSYKFAALYIGARASYHVNDLLNLNTDKVDLYGGATLGYRRFSWSDEYTYAGLGGSYGSGIYVGGFIGGKYYFGKAGIFAEVGAIGSTNARVGVAFKF